MQPRVSFVTLGVADVGRARAFYERLGFRASSASKPEVAFFDAGGLVLALWGRGELAKDAAVADDAAHGFSGVALAHNVATEAEVAIVLAEAEKAGATLTRGVEKVFWGGVTGYFADPDGHLWEVAYNPFMPLDADGRPTLPPPA